MPTNLNTEIAALKRMTPAQLCEKYIEVFGEPSRSGNKDFLFKRIAWRIQSLAEGDLSERARQRAAELARDADIRVTMPRQPKEDSAVSGRTATHTLPRNVGGGNRLPIPGTVLARKYRGRLIEVTVLPKGVSKADRVMVYKHDRLSRSRPILIRIVDIDQSDQSIRLNL